MTERKTIYLDDAIRIVERFYKVNEDIRRNMAFELRQLPCTQSERKKGEWIIDKDCEGKSRTVTCNLCGHEEFNWHDPNYCENCGAEMKGDIDD